jgi:hypothetical protein
MTEMLGFGLAILAFVTLWTFAKAFAKAAGYVAGAVVGLVLGVALVAGLVGLLAYLLVPQLLTVFMFVCAAVLGVHLVLNRVAVPPQHDTILNVAPPPLSAGIIFDGPTSPFYRPTAALPTPKDKPRGAAKEKLWAV